MENRELEEKTEYVAAIIVNLIFLYIFNNLLNWHIYFVTIALNEILWIINLTIAVAIIGNFLMLLYNPNWFRHTMKVILNTFAFIGVYFLFTIFPFDFNNPFLNTGLAVLLLLALVGIVIATIVEIYLLITGKRKL